ncbi:serpin family protein [Cystobacter ferrugineus]|uniref:Serpin n=1 Tax=Cystobacter ferrugineus TaxID=83449 RepID=A0A1L9BGT8_9BACT|nr:serpin family protein [Cystobacter ferrugineus]OJH41470.1 serpin [Cystobacter ferrugineus]
MTALRRWLIPSLVVALGFVGSACSAAPPGERIASDKARVTKPDVPAEDFAALVSGNTNFAASLYRQISKPGSNLLFSPFSISHAFAMVYAGARGDTESQMAQALHFTLPRERLHPAVNALNLALQARTEAKVEGGAPPSLRVVNAAWGQKGLAFESPFLDVLAQHYGTGMYAVDFTTKAESIREDVNAWVEKQTMGRIQDLLSEGMVTVDTRLLLANALYFKGEWQESFENTRDAPFHTLNGGTRQVPMMRGLSKVSFLDGEDFDAVAIPYKGQAFRMLVIVPDAGRFAEVESRLSADFLDSVRAGLRSSPISLGLPRFKVTQATRLDEALKALGMVDAFSEDADLSGVSQQEELLISAAQHQAFIAVDEKGTEAAAATAVVIIEESAPPPPYLVDRPFLFLIEDVETKSVLFLGRLVNP